MQTTTGATWNSQMSLPELNKKVAHLTSAHSRYDIRIFLKQCLSLADAGYSVSLVVADGKGDERHRGVSIYDVGASKGRFDRMHNAVRRVFLKAAGLNADIYHLHDPELIPIGLKLKKLGKRVIFDSHEDASADILSKPYIIRPARHLISRLLAAYEARACSRFDVVVAATPHIRDKFLPINPLTVDVNNFPILDEFATGADWSRKRRQVCYVGGIEASRGVREMVSAMSEIQSDARLQLAGRFNEAGLDAEVRTYAGWSRVDALGYLCRTSVRDLLWRSVAGLLIFHPTPNHIDAQPNKMFEYMSAGIPIIASNFPLWQEIIEENRCGLCVAPMNPVAIAVAIDFVMGDPNVAMQMGQNGQRAVEDLYNWSIEVKKLLALYERFF